MFCCTFLYVHSSIAIALMGKRELVALLNLSSWCLVVVEWLFLAVPRGCLRFVILVFPDHTNLLFYGKSGYKPQNRIVLWRISIGPARVQKDSVSTLCMSSVYISANGLKNLTTWLVLRTVVLSELLDHSVTEIVIPNKTLFVRKDRPLVSLPV